MKQWHNGACDMSEALKNPASSDRVVLKGRFSNLHLDVLVFAAEDGTHFVVHVPRDNEKFSLFCKIAEFSYAGWGRIATIRTASSVHLLEAYRMPDGASPAGFAKAIGTALAILKGP
jgi:hypothetical protein